jgi:hypothetical protein
MAGAPAASLVPCWTYLTRILWNLSADGIIMVGGWPAHGVEVSLRVPRVIADP